MKKGRRNQVVRENKIQLNIEMNTESQTRIREKKNNLLEQLEQAQTTKYEQQEPIKRGITNNRNNQNNPD
jgi:hypothetical protein